MTAARQAQSFTKWTPALGYAHAVYERPNFFLRAFWNRWDNDTIFSSHPSLAQLSTTLPIGMAVPLFRCRADTYNVEAQHALDLGTTNRLTYGFNYRYNTLSGNLYSASNYENRAGILCAR